MTHEETLTLMRAQAEIARAALEELPTADQNFCASLRTRIGLAIDAMMALAENSTVVGDDASLLEQKS